MQQTSLSPEAKAALAQCFAAHKALRSYSAQVLITVRGVPKQQNGQVRVALARPGRLRVECSGPRAQQRSPLLVASSGYLYSTFSPTKTYSTKRVEASGDALVMGLEETDTLPLPVFEQLMGGRDGLSELLAGFSKVTQEPGTLIFHGEGQAKQTLIFDPKDKLLREVRLSQGSDREIREVYQNVRANPALPESLWDFVPPAGYRDENAPMPPLPPAPKLGPGAVTTKSGLQYQDLKKGTGPAAAQGTTVTFHYKGSLTNGMVFQSSRANGEPPASFKLPGQVLPAWNEGILGMRPGGVRKLIAPPTLAFGDEGRGRMIPPRATLIFEIEMLEVKESTVL
ncbi:MAG: FKBP-type peptidyl-prolyl cis-trans isomerase [Armatimonadetes bacterium]|nr:FKBP-type peptidyl-prolyl cis-trans isomerase [Armatimonadota bacterium]